MLDTPSILTMCNTHVRSLSTAFMGWMIFDVSCRRKDSGRTPLNRAHVEYSLYKHVQVVFRKNDTRKTKLNNC